MAKCCICDRFIEREDAPVFAMGAAGQPRLLCDSCEELVETVACGTEFEKIEEAMDKIGKLMADGNPDRVTFTVANELMETASKRAKAIKDGSYDFSLDEAESDAEDELEEIPEELLESEEDKEKDRIEAENSKKLDKIYNVLLIIACVVAGGLIIYKALEYFGIDLSKFFDFSTSK